MSTANPYNLTEMENLKAGREITLQAAIEVLREHAKWHQEQLDRAEDAIAAIEDLLTQWDHPIPTSK